MKARDIVPGWPRGRSTERVRAHHVAREYMLYGQLWPHIWRFVLDPEFKMAVKVEREEERRKQTMMQDYESSKQDFEEAVTKDFSFYGIRLR